MVKSIIVEDYKGKTVTLEEKDGKYYFDLYDDVVVSVTFEKIVNPNTGVVTPYIICFIAGVISIVSIYLSRKKKYI